MTDRTNVVDLRERMLKNNNWQFSLDIFKRDGQWEADITGFQETEAEVGDRMREFAAGLEQIAFMMRQEAEKFQPSERGEALATVNIYRDSTVSVRIRDEEFTEPQQQDWLFERLDDAKEAAFS